MTETDGAGRMLRRYGQARGGRQIVYIDNRRFYRNIGIGVGIAAVGVGVALALSPPVVAMPRERYIVEYDRASDDDLYDVLVSPPIERLERAYSLEEIRYSHPLRERMRRIDLDTSTSRPARSTSRRISTASSNAWRGPWAGRSKRTRPRSS